MWWKGVVGIKWKGAAEEGDGYAGAQDLKEEAVRSEQVAGLGLGLSDYKMQRAQPRVCWSLFGIRKRTRRFLAGWDHLTGKQDA